MLFNTISEHLSKRIINGELTNDELVQLIELIGGYLNLKTRSAYSKENGMSYNGAKKFRQNIKIFGINFIIDND